MFPKPSLHIWWLQQSSLSHLELAIYWGSTVPSTHPHFSWHTGILVCISCFAEKISPAKIACSALVISPFPWICKVFHRESLWAGRTSVAVVFSREKLGRVQRSRRGPSLSSPPAGRPWHLLVVSLTSKLGKSPRFRSPGKKTICKVDLVLVLMQSNNAGNPPMWRWCFSAITGYKSPFIMYFPWFSHWIGHLLRANPFPRIAERPQS